MSSLFIYLAQCLAQGHTDLGTEIQTCQPRVMGRPLHPPGAMPPPRVLPL